MDVEVRRATTQHAPEKATRVVYTLWGDEDETVQHIVGNTVPILMREMADAPDRLAARLANMSPYKNREALWEALMGIDSRNSDEDNRAALASLALVALAGLAGWDRIPAGPPAPMTMKG